MNMSRFKNGFSPTSIHLLYNNPTLWKKRYLENSEPKELYTTSQIEGQLIHCYLLEPHEFNNKFIVAAQAPGSTNMVAYIESYCDSIKNGMEEESAMKLAYIASSYTAKKPLEKVHLEATTIFADYTNFLLNDGARYPVTQKQINYCLLASDKIKANPKLHKLLMLDRYDKLSDYTTGVDHSLAFSEIKLKSPKFDNFIFFGYLDRVVIDQETKTIRLIDFKTFGDHIDKFNKFKISDSGYDSQLGLYYLLLQYFFKHLSYKIEVYLLVSDTNLYQVPIKISQETLENWSEIGFKKFKACCDIVTKNTFDVPYRYLNGIEL